MDSRNPNIIDFYNRSMTSSFLGMEDRFKSLDLNLLRTFEALIQEENVTRAAERLHLTQPAVSNALSRLRSAFDDVLFEKARDGVIATPAARELWAVLEPHYRGLRDVLAPQSFDPAEYTGSVRIAMTDYTMERVMPQLAAFLQDNAPHLRLEVVLYSLANLSSLLEKEGVEIALGTYLDDSRPRQGIRTHVLWHIEYALLMRRGHPMSQGTIDIRELLRARHIDVRTQGMQFGAYDQVLAAHGLRRNLVLTLPSFQQAMAVLATTDCVAMLPNSLLARPPFSKSLVAVEPPIPLPARDLWIIWQDRHSEVPAHAWLRSTLISLFAKTVGIGEQDVTAFRARKRNR